MSEYCSRPRHCNPNDPEIAPGYTASIWRSLDLSSPTSLGWKTALEIFEARITARFLTPIEAIQNHSDPKVAEFSGFAIMALDCLLVETLGQFYLGWENTPSRRGQDVFERVLLHGYHFNRVFTSSRVVSVFRDHFRNGILHQAETKAKSCVRFGEPEMISQVDHSDPAAGLIVDRIKFHEALTSEFQAYLNQLRKPEDSEPRNNFKNKMTFIARA